MVAAKREITYTKYQIKLINRVTLEKLKKIERKKVKGQESVYKIEKKKQIIERKNKYYKTA